MLLFAIVTNNGPLRDFARLLIATEQQGSQTYWHLYPSASETDRDEPYPEQGLRDLITIGNVEDGQAGAWLYVLVVRPGLICDDVQFLGGSSVRNCSHSNPSRHTYRGGALRRRVGHECPELHWA